MARTTRLGIALCVAGTIGWAAAAHALVIIPPRSGQVGLGVQGEVGTLLKNGNVGKTFGSGPGLAVRLRYRTRYERAIGLSFEGQRFDTRDATLDSTQASLFTAGVDVYQLFGTRTRTTRMVSMGAGLAKYTVKLRSGETVFPFNDGLYLSAGAGLERFFWRSWAYDLSGRYMAVFANGKANHDFQAALGLIFYASY
jgi:hypothetical protein